MKIKLSITVDEELAKRADSVVEEGRFRNKSHILEYALKRLLKEEENDEES